MRKFKYGLLGCAIGLVVGVVTLGQVFPGIDPSIWHAYAWVTGLGASPFAAPVIWGELVSLGISPTSISLLSVGLLSFAVFDVFWRMLTILSCPSEESYNWWRLTVPLLSVLACVLTVFSEPVCRLTRSGSPALLTLSLCALAYDFFLVSFFVPVVYDYDGNPIGTIRQNIGRCAAVMLLGALIVETPVAFALPVLFVLVRRAVDRRIASEAYGGNPARLPVFMPQRVSPAITHALLFAGFAITFAASGALEHGGLALRRISATVHDVLGAATPLGWILWTGCTLVPFALNSLWSSALLGRDGRLGFARGLMVFLAGSVALLAVSPAMRGDWAILPSAAVHSPFMQALGSVLAAMAVAQTLAVFAYFACHERLRNSALRQLIAFVGGLMLAAAVAAAVEGARRGQALQVRQAIADAIDETVREARGLKWIFTDGSVDVGIELEALRRHQDLRVRPLVTGGPFAAAGNALPQLRGWISTDSPNLRSSAAQGGFDLWVRAGKRAPSASGMLAREDWPVNAREYGIVFAEGLGARMVGLVRAGALAREADASVRFAFAAVLRQLSRMARQRGDTVRADELDAAYDLLGNPNGTVRSERAAPFLRLTEAEALQLALKQADFVAARHFAAGVLKRLPDDVSANFGMGMSYLTEKKAQEAIPYLERAHKAKPAEPAILNNLAIAWLQKGDVEQAEAWARKALERAPDIPEIRDTVKLVQEAKRK